MKKQVQGHRSRIASFVASALATAAWAPSLTSAQGAGATLQGTAEANAEVTAKNVDTGLSRNTKAEADGSVSFGDRGAVWTYLTTDQPFGAWTERVLKGIQKKLWGHGT